MNVTTDRLQEFVCLVRKMRSVQAEYRRTIDPRLRRETERLEVELDAAAGWLAADLAADQAAAVSAIAVEGGVA